MNNWQAQIHEDMDNGILGVAHDAVGQTCAECGQIIFKPLDGLNYVRGEYNAQGEQIGKTEYFCNSQCLYQNYSSRV